jgi:hypothetical protein
MTRVFLLSPAHSSGRRAALLTCPGASFDLARRIQSGDATLGEVFTFCSGLYFRGKLAYARKFALAPAAMDGVQIITTSRGLLPADHPVNLELLYEFATVEINPTESRFVEPLIRSAQKLARTGGEVVLLGSIATGKYLDCLLPILGTRLLFPVDFVGRGDMSRGSLLLRSATDDTELTYAPVQGAELRKRPLPVSSAEEQP